MYCLLEDFEFTGDWWGPAGRHAANTFAGTLNFAGQQGTMSLVLDGMFENRLSYPYVDSVKGPSTITQIETCYELDYILGEQADGTRVSFIQCILENGREDGAGVTGTYGGRIAIVGAHKDSWHSLNYTRARFTFSGFALTEAATWTQDHALGWRIDDESWLHVDGKTGFNGLAVLEIGSDVEQHLQFFFERIFWLQSLFTMLQGGPCAITSLEVETASELVEQVLFRKDRRDIKPLHPNPLVQLARVGREDFEKVVRLWLAGGEKLKAAVYHFSSSLQFASPKHQVNLINVCQALEALHREFYPGSKGCYIPESDYEKLQTELNDVIGKNLADLAKHYQQEDPANYPAMAELIHSLKTSLQKGRIQFGNEKAQRRRLTELLRRLNGSLPKLLKPVIDNKLQFVSKIVDTRNYFIHFSDPEGKRLTELSLPFAVAAMESIFIALLLIELGINPTLVEQSIGSSTRWKNFQHALANWEQLFITEAQRHNAIAKLAYGKYVARDHEHGYDRKDWFDSVKEFDDY